MFNGVPIERQYVMVREDGSVVIDWGDGSFQDVLSGEFHRANEEEFYRPVLDHELDRLIKASRVDTYDRRTVYMLGLPEGRRRMLD